MGSYLYAGTFNRTTGGEVWRTNNGTAWTQVNPDGFGDADNQAVSAMAVFNDYLYASTYRPPGSPAGAEVWSCQTCDGTDWNRVVDNGFGNPQSRGYSALEATQAGLIFIVSNWDTGLEVWKTTDGAMWEQVGFNGLGDPWNTAIYWDNATISNDGTLLLGITNHANGGEIWLLLNDIFLPLIMR